MAARRDIRGCEPDDLAELSYRGSLWDGPKGDLVPAWNFMPGDNLFFWPSQQGSGLDISAGDHHIIGGHQQKGRRRIRFRWHGRVQKNCAAWPRFSLGSCRALGKMLLFPAYSGSLATSSSLTISRTPGVRRTIVSAILFSLGLGTFPLKTRAGPRLSTWIA